MKRYGKDAPLEAAARADELLDEGDLDGKAIWVRIMKAAEDLLDESSEGKTRH